MFKNLERYTLLLLVFLIPTQLAYHFWPDWAFVFGIRIDYLAPAIYLTDLFTLPLIVFHLKVYRKYARVLISLVLLASINLIFSTSFPASFFKWLKIFEFSLFGIYIIEQKVITTGEVVRTLFYSAVFFSLIGIAQFFLGKTSGGIFYFLGERTFNTSTPGIALVSLWGREYLRAYSTFSHPNSLAGYLGIVLIISLLSLGKNKKVWVGLLIVLLGITLTFSISSFIGLAVVVALYLLRKSNAMFSRVPYLILSFLILVSLCLPVVAANLDGGYPQRISQRLDLSYISGEMFSERFWLGEGINTFIINSPRLFGVSINPWVLQPVHNLFLLVVSETGILGLLLSCLLFYRLLWQNISLERNALVLAVIFILITATTDHYWLTLQQNLVLLSILIGLSFRIDAWKMG